MYFSPGDRGTVPPWVGEGDVSGRPWSERELEERVKGTLDLMASRGYNPSSEHLAGKLLGGVADVPDVEAAIEAAEGMDLREGLAFVEGKSYIDMCKRRLEANSHHQPLYREIAEAYTRDLVAACPWVRCVMLVGSVATGGLCEGDDLDLNLVVEDGRKYSTNLIGGLLNRKYSFRYRNQLVREREGHYLVPMVVCLNIIWEESQVLPLARQDEQVAYELFSGEVLHGPEFHRHMLAQNPWLRDYFPQMYDDAVGHHGRPGPRGAARPGIVERLSRGTLFAFDRLVRLYLSRRPATVERMEYWDDLKHPYGLYHLPGVDDEPYRGGDSGEGGP